MKILLIVRDFVNYLLYKSYRFDMFPYSQYINFIITIFFEFLGLFILLMCDVENYMFTASIFKYSIFSLYLKFKKSHLSWFEQLVFKLK